jgi:hypothetical protein
MLIFFGVFETIFHHQNVFGSFGDELWGRGQLIDFNLRALCLLTHIRERYQLNLRIEHGTTAQFLQTSWPRTSCRVKCSTLCRRCIDR